MAKFAIRKFDGDDLYSWAVFYAEHVKGKRGVIFWGEAKPVVSGLSKSEANSYKKRLEKG